MDERPPRRASATILPAPDSAEARRATIVAPEDDASPTDPQRAAESTADLPPRLTSPQPLAKGVKLGRWVLDCVLGEGATATVWSARHEQLGAPVAIKVFHRRDLPFQTVLGEARAAAGIPSRNAIWVYDVDTFGGHHAIVMELCANDGRIARSLKEELIDSVELAAQLISEAARGVQAAHAGSVFHKDIKPANILRNPDDGRAQITDFGLANPALWRRSTKAVPHDSQATVCMDAMVVAPAAAVDTLAPIRGSLRIGTPEFMAPEQAGGLRRDLDPHDDVARRFLIAIDVYGLGATLYHLLVGHPPFPHGVPDPLAMDAVSIMDQVIAGPPPAVRTLVPTVPRRLARIVAKAMARHPGDRYASAAALADDLDAWLAHRPTSVDRSWVSRGLVHLSRERARVALLAALAGVTLGSSWIVARNVDEIAAQSTALATQREELSALEAANAAVRTELASREAELSSTRSALTEKSGLLDVTGKRLADREAVLQTTAERLTSTTSELEQTTDTLSQTLQQRDAARASLQAAQQRVVDLEAEGLRLRDSLGTTRSELLASQAALDAARIDLQTATQKERELAAQVTTLQADTKRKQAQITAMETAEEAILREVQVLRTSLDTTRADLRALREEHQSLLRRLAELTATAAPSPEP